MIVLDYQDVIHDEAWFKHQNQLNRRSITGIHMVPKTKEEKALWWSKNDKIPGLWGFL